MKCKNYARAVCALLSNPTMQAAANSLGVSIKHIYALMDDEEFVEKFEEAQQKLITHTAGYLAQNLSKATSGVVEIIENTNYPVQVRLNACRTLLEFSCKFTETSQLLPRIKKLEQELELVAG